MKNNRRRIREMAERIVASWKKNAPDKEFGGIKVGQLEVALRKLDEALDALMEILQSADRQRILRDDVYEMIWEMCKAAKRGLLGDKDHGPSDPMLKEWGFKREDDFKTGLTRKKPEEAPEETNG
jgi:hypothetical protein